MSNQLEDGWYPECDCCGCGNLSGHKTICDECQKKVVSKKQIILILNQYSKIDYNLLQKIIKQIEEMNFDANDID